MIWEHPLRQQRLGQAVLLFREKALHSALISIDACLPPCLYFFLLVGIVYRMLVPASPEAPPAEITQAVPSEKPVKRLIAPEKVSEPAGTQIANAPPASASSPIKAPVTSPVQSPPSSPLPAAPVQTLPQQAESTQLTGLSEKVAGLEQQNAAMTNLLQSEVTQKLAAAEAQNIQLRSQIEALSSRIATMEVAFHQLAGMLGEVKARPGTMRSTSGSVTGYGASPSRSRAVRTGYTVQAIIPVVLGCVQMQAILLRWRLVIHSMVWVV